MNVFKLVVVDARGAQNSPSVIAVLIKYIEELLNRLSRTALLMVNRAVDNSAFSATITCAGSEVTSRKSV